MAIIPVIQFTRDNAAVTALKSFLTHWIGNNDEKLNAGRLIQLNQA